MAEPEPAMSETLGSEHDSTMSVRVPTRHGQDGIGIGNVRIGIFLVGIGIGIGIRIGNGNGNGNAPSHPVFKMNFGRNYFL